MKKVFRVLLVGAIVCVFGGVSLKACFLRGEVFGEGSRMALGLPRDLLARTLSSTRFSAPPVFVRKQAPVEMTRCTQGALPLEPTVLTGKVFYRDRNVTINSLDIGGFPYGQEIELKRKTGRIRAKYFASGAVVEKYMAWRPFNDVVLVCSGAFTNDYQSPQGLTIDGGVLVNKLVDTKMDGLIVVYPNGGIAVSNLEDGNLRYGSPETVANLRSYRDLQGFIDWAEGQQATVFQTQLLAYNNELKLEVEKARTSKAERRILVIARNPLGEVSHIIYNITTSEFLGDAASNILKFAQLQRGLEVVAMLNLDTGGENILEVYNDYGFKVTSPAGTVPLAMAVNLIAWSYTEM
jgi:hypothetical protein